VEKMYIQDFVANGSLSAVDASLLRSAPHAFLSLRQSHHDRIPKSADGRRVYPEPPGVIEILEKSGFSADRKSGRAQVHYEEYW